MKHLFPNTSAMIWKRFSKSERHAHFAGIFQERDFGDANLNLYRVAVLTSYFCNFISIATGFAFVYLLLSELYEGLPVWLSYLVFGIVSSVFLLFLEYLKRETVGSTAISWLKHGKVGVLRALIIVSLVSVSIFLSVKGAERFIRKVDQSVDTERLKQAETLDFQSKQYADAIQSQTDSLNAFKQSVSWKGRINVSNKTVAKTIDHFLGNIARLESEKAKSLLSLEKQFETQIADLTDASEVRADYMIWIALGNEISCILFILWVYYYAFRSYVEQQFDEEKEPNESHHDTSRQAMYHTRKSTQKINISTPQMTRNPIGFQVRQDAENASYGKRKAETLNVTAIKMNHTQGFKIKCDYCGKEAIKHNKSARFCSETCRSSFHLERYRDKRRASSLKDD